MIIAEREILRAMADYCERRSVMDIIKCLTCNTPQTEWTHGAYPDNGGTEAQTHKTQHPDHDVRTGDSKQLATMVRQ